MESEAREFAVAAHGAQRYGEHPYSYHLDAVAKIARPFGEVAETIAYLHDVVEDTSVTLTQIEERFGPFIAEAVSVLTDQPGATRKERKSKTYAKMASVKGDAEVALVVKAADRLANMRMCVENQNQRLLSLYRSEHKVFRQSAYRENACREIWAELDALAGD